MTTKKNPLTKFTDAELYAELKQRGADQELLKIQQLNINGITTKDFVVEYCDLHSAPSAPNYQPWFSFFIKRGKKKYDIYYGYSEKLKWWPTEIEENLIGETEEINAAYRFIPEGFSEAMENAYEYSYGTWQEAIECLKQHGFTTITDIQKKCGPTS